MKTPTTPRVTATLPFFYCSRDQDPLFSVRPDVPLDRALEQASLVPTDILRTLTSRAAAQDVLNSHQMETIHALEQQTGKQWYTHGPV